MNKFLVNSQYSWSETRRVRRNAYGFRHKLGCRRDSAGGYAVYIEKLQFICLVLCVAFICSSCIRQDVDEDAGAIPFLGAEEAIVDSILIKMSLEEKIGQLILWNVDFAHGTQKKMLYQRLQEKKIGGVLLRNLPIDEYLRVQDSCKQHSSQPLFFASDEAVSMHNQLADLLPYPQPATVAAVDSDSLQDALFEQLIQQYEDCGINLCLSVPLNYYNKSSIEYDTDHFRLHGKKHSTRVVHTIETLQQKQVLATGCDFQEWQYIENDSVGRLDSMLRSYLPAVSAGISAFTIGRSILDIDSFQYMQTHFLKNFLKDNLNFNGLLFARVESTTDIDKAMHAGADMLIVNTDPAKAYRYLYQYIEDGLISKPVLNRKVRKILRAKMWTQHKEEGIEAAGVANTYKNNDHAIYSIYDKSAVLINNPDSRIPFTSVLPTFQIVHAGKKPLPDFQKYILKYADFQAYLINPENDAAIEKLNLDKIQNKSIIITLDTSVMLTPARHQPFIRYVNQLSKEKRVYIANYGNPFNVQYFNTNITLLHIFEQNKYTESLAAQILFGGKPARGKLPLTINAQLPYGKGEPTEAIRLQYAYPEAVGIASHKLAAIDVIVRNAIANQAMPGAQVLVAKMAKSFTIKPLVIIRI